MAGTGHPQAEMRQCAMFTMTHTGDVAVSLTRWAHMKQIGNAKVLERSYSFSSRESRFLIAQAIEGILVLVPMKFFEDYSSMRKFRM